MKKLAKITAIFDEIVLYAIDGLSHNVTPSRIKRSIENAQGSPLAMENLSESLKLLEEWGLIRISEKTGYLLTPAGVKEINDVQYVRRKLKHPLPPRKHKTAA